MSSFCKCKSYSHFFSKNISIYAIFNDQSFNDTLTNNIVSFEQLGPGYYSSLNVSYGTELTGRISLTVRTVEMIEYVKNAFSLLISTSNNGRLTASSFSSLFLISTYVHHRNPVPTETIVNILWAVTCKMSVGICRQ